MIIKSLSLDEANLLLPIAKEHFYNMQASMMSLASHQKKLKLAKRGSLYFSPASHNITLARYPVKRSLKKMLAKNIYQMEEKIAAKYLELLKMGVIVRSIDPPHIDFYSFKSGAPFLFCWTGGEKNICHWHHFEQACDKRVPLHNAFENYCHVIH